MTQEERNQYVIDRLFAFDPEAIFDHYQKYGSKFGIYYWTDEDPDYQGYILTARFTPIGWRKEWETDDLQFKSLVDNILAG